ncbi:MAG: FG-GAP-like repeat-containing protein [Planctomycetota bacterium]|nr:FG-GAP-like repeat-containing protein [Planctomycetota bacterium]
MSTPRPRRSRPRLALLVLAASAACSEGGGEGAPAGAAEEDPAAPAAAAELVWRPLVAPAPREGGGPRFELLDPAACGVEFANRFDWDHPRRHLYPHGTAGGGVAAGDVDGDGLPELFFTSQVGRDRLYKNLGGLRFADASDEAGLSPQVRWGAGAVFADVEGDGDLDLFVCNHDAPNQLYRNLGDGTFEECGAALGLDFLGASVMGGFADYDLDGDLDLFVVTNRLYPGPAADAPRTLTVEGEVRLAAGQEESFAIQQRRIDGEVQRHIVKAGQRDRLYRNDGGRFTEVGAAAGIAGFEPGLSATWWDFDADGFADLYVANDFWDADRLYHNQGDGTFRDVLGERVPHTPWFSMGADFADLDGDGRQDLLVADMAPTTHFMSKLMMGDMGDSRWFLESAEPPQYMRNALFLGSPTGRFVEAAFLAGLASSDWTWSVKLADLDDDGRTDAFFTNGTANHSFDPDLTRELGDLELRQDHRLLFDPVERRAEQWALYRTRGVRAERNLAFRNGADLEFEDVSAAWGLDLEGLSFGAVCADLDRDGDLDLVLNNTGGPASVHANRGTDGRRLLVEVRSPDRNRFGIGSRVSVTTAAGTQSAQLFTTRGYQSADEPVVHFGLGEAERVAELTVETGLGQRFVFSDLAVDRRYTVRLPVAASEGPARPAVTGAPRAGRFRERAAALGLGSASSVERPFDDYARQPLLPARLSRLGPGLAWGDADGDGRDDLFVGGAAGRGGGLFLARDQGFERAEGPWDADGECEDLACVWFDLDADGDLDLFVASGGVECEPGDALLRDRVYRNGGDGLFERASGDVVPDARESSHTAVCGDVDGDGDLDLFVGARSVPGRYPLAPRSRLLRNDGGRLVDATDELAPGLAGVGMVTAALFSDVDGDGRTDLLVAVDWGPVTLWRSTSGGLVDETARAGLGARRGWWRSVSGADLDADGRLDLVVGNAGLNTRYHASPEEPVLLYRGDFGEEDGEHLVEAKTTGKGRLPVRGLSCSSGAMPFLGERFPTYRAFAGSSLEEIYTASGLDGALELSADELRSGVWLNRSTPGEPAFEWRPLPRRAQVSPVYGVVACELDGDGTTDLFCAQNFFHREPETGRWDGGQGALLLGDGSGGLAAATDPLGLVVAGDGTAATVADWNGDGRPDVCVGQNGGPLLAFEHGADEGVFLAVRLAGPPGNPTCVGARVVLERADGSRQSAEVGAGGGCLSQSSPTLFFGAPGEGPARLSVRWPDGGETAHDVATAGSTMWLTMPTSDSTGDRDGR